MGKEDTTIWMKRMITFVQICIYAMLALGCGERDSFEFQLRSMEDRVVRIVCSDKAGSGVIYHASDDIIVIVTAAHVVDGQKNVEIVFGINSGTETVKRIQARASDITIINGLDLAFIKASGNVIWNTVIENAVSDFRTIIGYDEAGSIIVNRTEVVEDWIYLNDFQNYMMVLNGEAYSGMSGGGVFDNEGNFSGIICGKDARENIAVIPINVIEAEYTVWALQNLK